MDEETTTQHTMRLMRMEWQQRITEEIRRAILAELNDLPDRRDAMLRQVADIERQYGIGR